jgi:chromosome partitioning protein
MGLVFAFANQKGGAGKTTLSVNVAGELKRRGYEVLVVDADPQDSSMKWSSYADEDNPFPMGIISLAAAGNRMGVEVERYRDKYDIIVIDCPPHKGVPQTLAAMCVADLVILPLRPSFMDLAPTVETIDVLEQAKAMNPDVVARAVLNCVRAGTKSQGKIVKALAKLDVPTLSKRISLFEEYADAVEEGQVVAFRKASDARAQINELTDEICELMQIPLVKEEAA